MFVKLGESILKSLYFLLHRPQYTSKIHYMITAKQELDLDLNIDTILGFSTYLIHKALFILRLRPKTETITRHNDVLNV